MDPLLIQYLLFILAALLIIGAVISLNRWLARHHAPGTGSPTTWIRFDPRRAHAREEARTDRLPAAEEDQDEAELQVRARQNGHHTDF